MTRYAGVLALALVAGAGALPAQTLRDFSTARQLHGETRLTAHVTYGAGTLHLAPAASGDLYRMRLSYDADRYIPLGAFDASSGTVRLGVKGTGGSGLRVVSTSHMEQSATIGFSPDVALALDVELGAAESTLELGGLHLSELHLTTGGSRTTVRFSRPNPGRCDQALVSTGAADITVLNFGNSRCRRARFEGGVGRVLLDLSGAWPADASLDLRMAVGALTLRLPRSAGVRVTVSGFLSSFPAAGWTRRGSVYTSPGYAAAARHLNITLATAMGGVTIEWVE